MSTYKRSSISLWSFIELFNASTIWINRLNNSIWGCGDCGLDGGGGGGEVGKDSDEPKTEQQIKLTFSWSLGSRPISLPSEV